MLEVDRIADITRACEAPSASPEAERFRGMCNELLDQITDLAERDIRHLGRLVAEHGAARNDDLVDTARRTQNWLMRVAAAARSPRR